jgi:hypothetical protein
MLLRNRTTESNLGRVERCGIISGDASMVKAGAALVLLPVR